MMPSTHPKISTFSNDTAANVRNDVLGMVVMKEPHFYGSSFTSERRFSHRRRYAFRGSLCRSHSSGPPLQAILPGVFIRGTDKIFRQGLLNYFRPGPHPTGTRGLASYSRGDEAVGRSAWGVWQLPGTGTGNGPGVYRSVWKRVRYRSGHHGHHFHEFRDLFSVQFSRKTFRNNRKWCP
jgi:hypothetical protein